MQGGRGDKFFKKQSKKAFLGTFWKILINILAPNMSARGRIASNPKKQTPPHPTPAGSVADLGGSNPFFENPPSRISSALVVEGVKSL